MGQLERDERRNKAFLDQLGMSYSKARSLLVKEIRFQMLSELGEIKCCRNCANPLIIDFNDMDKDHIKPWRKTSKFEGSKENFWDLNNIGWSHCHCNRSHPKGGTGDSSYFGVNRSKNSWQARIMSNKLRVNGGIYNEEKDAALVYDFMVMIYKNGSGMVNFSSNISFYKEFLKDYKEMSLDKGGMAYEFKELINKFKENYNGKI